MTRWAVAALLWAGCNGDKDDGETGETGETGAPVTDSTGAERVATILALPGDEEAAETTYATVCAACHGADGAGGIGVPPSPSLIERVPGLTDEQIVTTILEGKGNMDAYAAVLDNQEIADLLARLRALYGPEGAR